MWFNQPTDNVLIQIHGDGVVVCEIFDLFNGDAAVIQSLVAETSIVPLRPQ